MTLTPEQCQPQLKKLVAKLDERARQYQLLERYIDATPPVPQAITDAKLTKSYERLMPVAGAPWGALVVDSKLDRLEVSGIRAENKDAADKVWGVWQDNQMDSESKLGHSSALLAGRVFALVWPGDDGQPEISLDSAEQMVVMYAEGSRRRRVAALRRWLDDDGAELATLYRPEGIYKFRKAKADERNGEPKAEWEPRVVKREDDTDEPWPVPNPWDLVPVVEVAVNRRLKPGSWAFARGEFEHCAGLLDRIHLLTFLGLVVAFWQGFPIRGVIGDRILRDDDNNPLPPFEGKPGEVAQIEDPQAKTFEFKAADRDNLLIYPELAQLAAITHTPRHYFPLAQAMANLSADAIRADEGGQAATVVGHKASLGEGWEEVNRLSGLMLDAPVDIGPRAELVWKDHESRSMAERADAATKLKDILPQPMLLERVLNLTQGEVAQARVDLASTAIGNLLANGAGADPAGAALGPSGRTPAPPTGNEPAV